MCISPLTAIMIEQVQKFNNIGISAEFVGEAQIDPVAKKKVLHGEVKIVLITPENAIQNALYRNMFLTPQYKNHMVALIVDEAHCVRMW